MSWNTYRLRSRLFDTAGAERGAGAPPGTLVALPSSFGLLEIALVQGSAARHLGATIGMPVYVRKA